MSAVMVLGPECEQGKDDNCDGAVLVDEDVIEGGCQCGCHPWFGDRVIVFVRDRHTFEDWCRNRHVSPHDRRVRYGANMEALRGWSSARVVVIEWPQFWQPWQVAEAQEIIAMHERLRADRG